MEGRKVNMDEDNLVLCITIILIVLIIVLGISVPCLISEKRNIEKELLLKEIEVYGERRTESE